MPDTITLLLCFILLVITCYHDDSSSSSTSSASSSSYSSSFFFLLPLPLLPYLCPIFRKEETKCYASVSVRNKTNLPTCSVLTYLPIHLHGLTRNTSTNCYQGKPLKASALIYGYTCPVPQFWTKSCSNPRYSHTWCKILVELEVVSMIYLQSFASRVGAEAHTSAIRITLRMACIFI